VTIRMREWMNNVALCAEKLVFTLMAPSTSPKMKTVGSYLLLDGFLNIFITSAIIALISAHEYVHCVNVNTL